MIVKVVLSYLLYVTLHYLVLNCWGQFSIGGKRGSFAQYLINEGGDIGNDDTRGGCDS